MAKLNAGGAAPLGPLKQLTVQKGDTVTVTAPGLYPQKVQRSFWFSLASFLTGLLQPAPSLPAPPDAVRRGGLPLLQVGVAAGLASVPQLSGGVPKGYVRVLVFNEDSALVDQRTVQLTAAALGHYETLATGPLVVQQNGYVTVYVGNESAADVYFDDVTIEHRPGLQVQENQYDPTGLDLAGVSGAAVGLRLKNYYQFNGKENQLDLGLHWNHQDWRFYDYQIGRWHVVDPEIENDQESWTPYQFGYDNAVRYADADGRWPGPGGITKDQVSTGVHTALDVAGLVPGLGEIADGLNAVGYLLEGNKTDAALSAAAMIPFAGMAATGAKFLRTADKVVTAAKTAEHAAEAGRNVTRAADKVADATKTVKKGCGCFTAGTSVSTRLGRKVIEQIQVGDSVWAYNERTRQAALRPVTHLFRYERDTVYVLHTATGEALRTTSDHPFFVRGRWVKVKHLRVGDALVSQSGQRYVLRRIEHRPEHVTVYNFTVDELHTYFVG
ncbi:MAG TPA: polymorphic toxin-type HINT domain-containing protein [Hymenobacter sp.]